MSKYASVSPEVGTVASYEVGQRVRYLDPNELGGQVYMWEIEKIRDDETINLSRPVTIDDQHHSRVITGITSAELDRFN